MPQTLGEIDAASGSELTALAFGMDDSVTLEDIGSLFVLVEMKGSFARRDPSDELRNLAATEIGVNQIAKFAILARTNHLAILLMHGPSRCFARSRRNRILDDAPFEILGTARTHNPQAIGARILDAALRSRRDEDAGSGPQFISEAVDVTN